MQGLMTNHLFSAFPIRVYKLDNVIYRGFLLHQWYLLLIYPARRRGLDALPFVVNDDSSIESCLANLISHCGTLLNFLSLVVWN